VTRPKVTSAAIRAERRNRATYVKNQQISDTRADGASQQIAGV